MTTGKRALDLNDDDIDCILDSVRANDQEDLNDCLNTISTAQNNVNHKDILLASVSKESGNSVLHYAAGNGLTCKILTQISNIQLTGPLLTDMTALLTHIFKILESPSSLEFINHYNGAGNTALHWSSLNGHLETTKILVENGADLWIRNRAGNLAVFEAENAGKDDIVAFLLQAGGTEKEKESEDHTTGQKNGENVNDGGEDEDIIMQAGDMSGNNSEQNKHIEEGVRDINLDR